MDVSALADGRWPMAESSVVGWPKQASVAGHFCGLSPNYEDSQLLLKKMIETKDTDRQNLHGYLV
jgi:hypothetical protein